MRVLAFGTYDVTTHPRVAVLLEGLRRNGLDVLECNAPLGLGTADRVAMLRRPWLAGRLLVRLLRRWTTLCRRVWSQRLPPVDAVLIGYLGHFDVHLARLLFRGRPIVLDHLVGASDTAVDRGVRGGVKHRILRFLDDAALRAADIVVVDTDEHAAVLPDFAQVRAVVVAVGADERWFAARPTLEPPDHRLRAVFFGLFTPLQGAPVIAAALSYLPKTDFQLTMIGTGQDHPAVRGTARDDARVRWLDWVSADELPALVAAHDVCLGIFGTGPKAQRVVPTKVFQGAAAGCALVTSDTAPQRRILGDAAILVPPGDPAALAAALEKLAADSNALLRSRVAAARLADQRFRAEVVVTQLVDRLTARVRIP